MGSYYPLLLASRILYDSDRSSASTADDAGVTGWLKSRKFILATQIGYDGKDTAASAYKLQWRNVTDNGSFADVAGDSGEIRWAATSAVLTDGAALVSGNARCTSPSGQTWQDGLENAGDNLLPDSGSLDLGSDCFTELQWALDPAYALDGKLYEFRLWNNSSGASVGTCLAQITMTVMVIVSGLISTTAGLAGSSKTARSIISSAATITVAASKMNLGRPLAGAIQTTADVANRIELILGLLGPIISLSALQSNLSRAAAIAGEVASSSELVILSAVSRKLISSSVTAISAWNAIILIRPLVGLINTASSFSNWLSVTFSYAGQIISASNLPAVLSREIGCGGEVSCRSGLSGLPAVARGLVGSAVTRFLEEARATLIRPIEGAIQTASVLSDGLILAVGLEGSIRSVSSLPAGLSRAIDIFGEAFTSFSLAGFSRSARRLFGSSATVSLLNGSSRLSQRLIGSLPACSLITGIPLVGRLLIGSINAGTNLAGSSLVSRRIIGSAVTHSASEGNQKVKKALAAACATSFLLASDILKLIGLFGSISTLSDLLGSLPRDILLGGSSKTIFGLVSSLRSACSLASTIFTNSVSTGVSSADKALSSSVTSRASMAVDMINFIEMVGWAITASKVFGTGKLAISLLGKSDTKASFSGLLGNFFHMVALTGQTTTACYVSCLARVTRSLAGLSLTRSELGSFGLQQLISGASITISGTASALSRLIPISASVVAGFSLQGLAERLRFIVRVGQSTVTKTVPGSSVISKARSGASSITKWLSGESRL